MDSVKEANTPHHYSKDTDTLKLDSLVESAIGGSFEAFDKIMVHYRERMYGVIYNMTLNHSDAADLTQETFVKLFVLFRNLRENLLFYLALSNRSQPNFDLS
jgi:hypothetical protein